MARLIAPGELKTTYWVDARGKKVKKGTPGAVLKTCTNAKYYIGYRKPGCRNETKVAAYRDKRASEAKLKNLVEALERGEEGLVDPFKEHLARRAGEHLGDYLPHLRDRVSNDKYACETERLLRRALEGCRAATLADLTAARVADFLVGLKVAANTKKKYHSALSGFATWLHRRGRTEHNFLDRVEPPRGRVEAEYRSLSADEINRVLEVARSRPLRDALTVRRGARKGELVANVRPEVRAKLEREGRGRRLLYLAATLTAMRKEELARLRVGHVDFARAPCPLVNLPAELTKGKKKATFLLLPALAEELWQWADDTGRGPDDLLFDVPDDLHLIFFRDMAAAGIARRTPKGEASFRSLRKSANVLLREQGVTVRERQLFMRHSDVRLTADTYDDGLLEDMAASIMPALERLRIG